MIKSFNYLSVFALTITIFICLACNSTNSDGNQQNNNESLIPLQSGNTWTLGSSNDQSATATISGTQVINDQEYYKIDVEGYFEGQNDSQIVYARNTSDGVLIGQTETPATMVQFLLKYPVQDGEIYDQIDEEGNEYSITVNDTTITTQAGEFTCKFYNIEIPTYGLGGGSACLSPEVGLVEVYGQELISYDLN